MKKKYLVLLSIGLILLIVLAVILLKKKTPEDYLEDFYNNENPEATFMDPLIIAGDVVVPLVIAQIKEPFMPRRRYAIGFLGNGGYIQALPALELILTDKTENELFRGDALEAIYMIDQEKGLKFSDEYAVRTDFLGYIARKIIENKNRPIHRRSYQDAVEGVD